MENNGLDNFNDLHNDYFHHQTTLQDEHELIKIVNKSPVLKNIDIGKIVRGDVNSNILTFEVNRFYDGADLSTKGIRFLVKVDNTISVELASNLQYNDELIRFSWVMSHFATSKKSVTIAIEFYGVIDDDRDYSLKTTSFTIPIEDSLDINDKEIDAILDKPENYLTNISNRLEQIEEKLSDINGDSFATLKDITDAIENIKIETVPIDFIKVME